MKFQAYPPRDGLIIGWWWSSIAGRFQEEQAPALRVYAGRPVEIEVDEPGDENLRMAAQLATGDDLILINFSQVKEG